MTLLLDSRSASLRACPRLREYPPDGPTEGFTRPAPTASTRPATSHAPPVAEQLGLWRTSKQLGRACHGVGEVVGVLGLDLLVNLPASPQHARWDTQPVVDGSLMIRPAAARRFDLPVAAGQLVAPVKRGDQGTVDDQASAAGCAVDQCEPEEDLAVGRMETRFPVETRQGDIAVDARSLKDFRGARRSVVQHRERGRWFQQIEHVQSFVEGRAWDKLPTVNRTPAPEASISQRWPRPTLGLRGCRSTSPTLLG